MSPLTKVSVIIPTYGTRDGLLERAICALEPLYRDDGVEILLVDDATPSDSVQQLAQRHPWVEYVLLAQNGGVAVAQNAGVQRATGTHVRFLHSDDELNRTTHRRQVALAQSDPTLVCVGGKRCFGSVVLPDPLPSASRADFFAHRFSVHVGPYLFRRDWLLANPFDECLRSWEDWDLLYRVVDAGVRIASTTDVAYFQQAAASERLSTSHHMLSSLQMLRTKYDGCIRESRRVQGLWEFKIGRLAYRLGQRTLGLRRMRAGLALDPFHPRRIARFLRYAMSKPTTST